MRVTRVHFRGLPDFLRNARVRQHRIEAVPQRMKAQTIICAPLRRVTRDRPLDVRSRHDCGELSAQSELSACAFTSE